MLTKYLVIQARCCTDERWLEGATPTVEEDGEVGVTVTIFLWNDCVVTGRADSTEFQLRLQIDNG